MAHNTSVARGTAFGVTAQAWQLLTAFFLYHYLSTELGPAGFGEWRVTLSVVGYFQLLIENGVVRVAAKRLAESPQDETVIERGAYFAQMVVALGLFVALQLGAGTIAALLREPALEPFIRIGALDVPLIALLLLAGNMRLGKHHFVRQAAGMMAYATAKFVLIGALVWYGLSVPGALLGSALASLVGFAFLFAPWERARVPFSSVVKEARGMGINAIPFLAQTVISGPAGELSLWFVQALRGSSTAGLFSAATVIARIPDFLFEGLNRVIFPSVARAGAEKNEALVARYVTQAVRLALLVTILAVAVIAATGKEALLLIYAAPFAAAAPVLSVLMIASIGQNVGSACNEVMMARDQRRQALMITALTVLLEIVILATTVSRFGPMGAAWATVIGELAGAAAACWVLRDLLGRRIVWTMLRSGVAAALVGVALAVVRPMEFWLIPAYLLALLVYGALLWILREFDSDDLNSLRGITRRTQAVPPAPDIV